MSKETSFDVAISLKKKTGYIFVALFMSLICLFVDIADYIAINSLQIAGLMPLDWRGTFFVGHAVSFYVFLVGFIYVVEAGESSMFKWAWLTLAINLTAFILRLVYELVYIDYLPMSFA